MTLRYLIDVDGFEIDGKFLVKEMAIADLETEKIKLYSFKVGSFHCLSDKHKKQVRWVTRHIHGLMFRDKFYEHEQEKVSNFVNDICLEAIKTNALIGYKGGHYEYDILNALGFSHLAVNIEKYDCPKMEKLLDEYPESVNFKCSRHKPLIKKFDTITLPHCPKMEVYCFMRFMKNNYKV